MIIFSLHSEQDQSEIQEGTNRFAKCSCLLSSMCLRRVLVFQVIWQTWTDVRVFFSFHSNNRRGTKSSKQQWHCGVLSITHKEWCFYSLMQSGEELETEMCLPRNHFVYGFSSPLQVIEVFDTYFYVILYVSKLEIIYLYEVQYTCVYLLPRCTPIWW